MSSAAENYLPFENLLPILFWTPVDIECVYCGTSCNYADQAGHHEMSAADPPRLKAQF